MSTFYSQHDPRWSDLKLGNGSATIGSVGCLLTCCSMVLNDIAQVNTTPDVLNRWMIRNKEFVNVNEIDLTANPLVALGVKLTQPVIFCETVQAPMDVVASALSKGLAVIVKINFYPGVSQMHYVRLMQVLPDDCLINDPWMLPGTGLTHLMPRYAKAEWNSPGTPILRIAIFGRVDGKVTEPKGGG